MSDSSSASCHAKAAAAAVSSSLLPLKLQRPHLLGDPAYTKIPIFTSKKEFGLEQQVILLHFS